MFRSFILFCICLPGILFAKCEEPPACCESDFYCDDLIPRSRGDQVPLTHVQKVSDEYLSGYVQALIDMHYFEFSVRVCVKDGIAYILNLPKNELIASSIICFVLDVPCIQGLQRMECCDDSYLCEEFSCDDSYLCQEFPCIEECEFDEECMPCDSQIAFVEMPAPCCQIDGIWFPQSSVLFAPLIADPRQVTYSGAIRFNDDVVGKHVGAVSFGDDFPIFRWKNVWCWNGDLQIGIEAGVFAVFDLDAGDKSLVNTDFFVSIPLTYAVDRWSFRFRIYHQSSHLGDEFMVLYPDIDRKNPSDEAADFFASYQLNQAIRLYGGVGYIFRRDDSFPKDPFYVEYGTELRLFGMRDCYNRLYMQPFLAMHFRNWEEHNYNLDATYALGVEWSKLQGVGRKLRIFIEYHEGYSEEGQFCKKRSNYIAVRTTYGF